MYEHIAIVDALAARRFLDDINGRIEWIAKLGITGSPRDFIPGLRAFPYRRRCIYFFIDDENLSVLRVLHGRQEIKPSYFLPFYQTEEKD
ncbi:type II toxin-antitoxin system RelE/ParE family toxin [Rhizobium sp. S152]|uniref:type II toxin-antitoxin system RelE/ParE family toxin n=1 Tax=Rhizobium sp. S152 TaxID=3055038 RepID=UPI0025AA119D|nr:type II toxin-antitoxin system RelE/ParE family toxin [Rhizobium sp. S152]MDM9629198.1 type II toxin-antitoxin system RelE/ParE family toxin [Rhizobium sp. S152]